MESWSNTERSNEGHVVERTELARVQAGGPEIHSIRATRSTRSARSMSVRPLGFPQIRIGDESCQSHQRISPWSNIRLQILIWHCGLLYRILQGFVCITIASPAFRYHIFVGGPGVYPFAMIISCAGALGCCFAVALMVKAGVAPITQASLFITSSLIFTMSFLQDPGEAEYDYNGPLNWNTVVQVTGCLVSGLTGSALTPAAFLTISSSYSQKAQPVILFIWGAVGLVGDIAIELVFAATGSPEISWPPAVNSAMAIQGLYFAAFSLGVNALLDTTVRDAILLRSKTSSSNTSFGRETLHKYAAQLLAIVKDPQAYFFLSISISDGFMQGEFSIQSCGLLSIYSTLAAILLHVVCGLVVYRLPQIRITLLATSLTLNIVFVRLGNWYYDPIFPAESCRGFWIRAIAVGVGNIPIICIASLFAANICGSMRRATIVAMICSGYRLGSMFKEGLPLLQEPLPLPLYICSGIMILATAFYGAWLFHQNKKKRKVVADLGLSEGESMRLNSIATDSGMTDIENIHYRYCF